MTRAAPADVPGILAAEPAVVLAARLTGLLGAAGSALDRSADMLRLPSGGHVYTPGRHDPHLYLVRAGRVKTAAVTRQGRTCLLDIHGRYDIFGESCLLEPVRDTEAVAMAPSELVRIPLAAFLDALATGPAYEESLRFLVGRLAEQRQRITQLVTRTSEQRLATVLLGLSRKLGEGHERHRRIDQRITQEELAQLVGTTRSRVGHFLKKFRAGGLVHRAPGHTLIVDEPRLRAYAETTGS
ncbi:Crp/Fnr family transcriptional regulator [Streptomyces sp. NPDC051172]|uniref:Crp/Fnr family transcriptional regulator n=1 Tax=Streptomyces sp. NPDC051172 TaxID=3155796 RepID=UPI00343EC07D